ncbi:unnamed protein product [Lactuca virosa]|uniref:Uncharacterized protein n=1 Tax=Lactuca virosa TaxID=75947 RepID=A0AAU9L9Q6_9ASTR|nr:unnamed protein product [Lactuca virosa]
MEDSLEGEEMEEEKPESDEENETTKDSEPMEAEAAPPSRPSPPSPYRSILERVGKTRQTAKKPHSTTREFISTVMGCLRGIGKGNQGRREQHNSRNLESGKTGDPADPTSEYTDRMRGLLNTEIAARIQQDTYMVEADLQAQATLIKVGVNEEEIMAINGRLDAIRVQLGKITRALGTYLQRG